MTRASRRAGFVASLVALSLAAPAQGSDPGARREQARARLVPVFGSDARVQVDPASGVVRFAAAAPGRRAVRGAPRALGAPARSARAAEFLRAYGALYGVSDAGAELLELRTEADRGGTRIVYGQRYRGLPVFAGELRAHFDAGDRLVAVNGRLVPVDPVDTLPTRSADEAGRAALAAVAADLGAPRALEVREASLVVFREGFVRGTPGTTHLAWEVEVGDGGSVREAVFVDAHTGKPIDRISRAPDALFRRAYNALGQPAPGPDYPHAPLWVEGDPLPTGFRGADRVLQFSRETYEFFARAFGRDSFDGAGATLDAIFNRGDLCPNASWNGIFAAFCPGTITDDLTAHEWTHAYTDYTHDLIYQWQPGALNEAYSDIFGEVVDLLNGVEGEERNGARSAGECSESTQPPARIVVEAPLALAGALAAGGAVFNPASFEVTGEIALVEDGVGVGSDGCSPLLNAAEVAGRIALVDRGTCLFVEKVAYAQASGAVGVIVANDAPGLFNMAGADPTLAIPALLAAQPDGAALRAALASGPVRASLRDRRPGRDASERWLVGEDANAFGGAIRDAWNPVCHGDPGRVGEASYWCSVGDGGGVHTNSGVPNHAFALLADGGSYRGHTLGGIGLTRAAHVYFRAQSVYQFPASDFTDHADALEQSCIDLIGVDLPDLATGAPSGEALTAADCAQVEAAVAAVELRTPPTRCGFEPLLAQEPPPLCAEGFVQRIFGDGFEHPGAAARFAASHVPVSAEFTRRDWEIVGDLPDGRAGRAFFAPDPEIGTCLPGGDESGVLLLLSPRIRIPAAPASEPMLSFEHWVATEAGWDGGNLEIRVNGGEWRLVEAGDFVYNAYNTTLFSAEQLNTNPMASEPAFSGTDGGTVDGSWGRSIVRLAPYAGPRDTIELRFRFGTDGCTGRFGWYVDDLLVYRCRDGRGPSESSSRER
jgi:Zn-dependent metalloprotease